MYDGSACCVDCLETGIPDSRGLGGAPGGIAIASLVIPLVSVFGLCFVPAGILAITGMIMGYIELGRIKKGKSPRGGRSFALAGAIIGTTMTVLISIFVILIFAAAE